MTRIPLFSLVITASLSGAAAIATEAGPAAEETCRTIRFQKDGSVVESNARYGSLGVNSASASASGSASSTSRSSVSVSSSTSGSGRSSASSSSYSDGRGRSVTVSQDENGCTVTIDERTAQGE